jgi:hypothetical protein
MNKWTKSLKWWERNKHKLIQRHTNKWLGICERLIIIGETQAELLDLIDQLKVKEQVYVVKVLPDNEFIHSCYPGVEVY